MLASRLIERKRDGGRLEAAEWDALARAYDLGDVPDYQMAAFLMATYLRGLDNDVFFKVGLIAVMGLSAKNAILIIEFAKDLHISGVGLVDATLRAWAA